MNSEPQRCALPGCDVLIETPQDGSAPRKYCCTEHRFAARRLRSSTRATEKATPAQAVTAPPQPAVDPEAAWRRRARAAIDRAIRGITTVLPTDNGLFDPNRVTGPSATTPVERVVAELTHTIDASVIARALRRRRRTHRQPVRRTPHRIPRQRPSTPTRKPAVRRTSALSNPTRRRPITAAQRRLRRLGRRTGVVVAGIAVAAMGAWLVTNHPWTAVSPSTPSVAQAQLPQLPALPADGDQWATNAQLALTSVDQQLTQATEAVQTWQSSPAARTQPTEPPAVTALNKQITALRQEHDQLQSALNTWHAASQAHDALAATGAQYSAIAQPSSTPTAAVEGPRPPTATSTASPATQPQPQPQALASQAATQRAQLDSLLPQVRNNMAAPLPAAVNNIGALANSVLDLTRQQPQPTTSPTHSTPPTRPAPKPSTTTTEPTQPPVPTATKTPQPTGVAPQPPMGTTQPVAVAPTRLVPVVLPAQPAPARPVTLVPAVVPNPPVATKPTVPAQIATPLPRPNQPAPTTPAPPNQSELDSLAALRDIEAMSTLAAAAQRAPEGSQARTQLTEEAAAGLTKAMAQHLGELITYAADNSSGDGYGADGYGADGADAD